MIGCLSLVHGFIYTAQLIFRPSFICFKGRRKCFTPVCPSEHTLLMSSVVAM